VQQSLPLPCRGDFPVSWGEHVSRGLAKWWPAKWPNRGKPWALDPCPSLLDLGSVVEYLSVSSGEDPSLEIDREDLRDRMIGDDHVFLETHGIRWLFKALSVLAKFERLHKRPLVG
jgi:hypothetical protein